MFKKVTMTRYNGQYVASQVSCSGLSPRFRYYLGCGMSPIWWKRLCERLSDTDWMYLSLSTAITLDPNFWIEVFLELPRVEVRILNLSIVLLLELYGSHGLSIINIKFEHKGLIAYTQIGIDGELGTSGGDCQLLYLKNNKNLS